MRFLFEIIFCIGAAYGIGWFFSNYGRMARQPGDSDRTKPENNKSGVLALVSRAQESAVPGRPMRDRSWLS